MIHAKVKNIICFIAATTLAAQSFCPIFAESEAIVEQAPQQIEQTPGDAIVKNTNEDLSPVTIIACAAIGLSLPFILAAIGSRIGNRGNGNNPLPNPNDIQERERRLWEAKEKIIAQKFKATGFWGHEFPLSETKTKLENFIGRKPIAIETYIDQVKEPERFQRLGCTLPESIIIAGAPGTGKTTLARGLANHLDGYLFELSGASLQKKYVGESTSAINAVFNNARELAASCQKGSKRQVFILLDEIQGAFAGLDNEKGGSKAVSQKIASVFNHQLSLAGDRNKGITIIATTNNLEMLPEPLKRPGRSRIINIDKPNAQDRQAIFKKYIEGRALDENVNDDFYQNELARRIQGFTGADIEDLLKCAAEDAAKKRQNTIKKENILAVIPEVTKDKENKIRKSKFAPIKTRVKLEDLAGSQTPEVAEVIDMFKNAEHYSCVGASMPDAVLLYGPPGTGKSTLVRGIATELDAYLFTLAGSDLTSNKHGGSQQNVNLLFKNARENAKNTGKKSIILLDEFDGALTGLNSDQNWDQQTLSKLKYELTQPDDINKDIHIFATSNHPEALPEALTRPGRLRKIRVPLPQENDREAIFKKYAEDTKYTVDDEVKQAEFYQQIARETNNFSGAELKEIMEKAARDAGSKRQQTIKKQNIVGALGELQRYVAEQKSIHRRKMTRFKRPQLNDLIHLHQQKHCCNPNIKHEMEQHKKKKRKSLLVNFLKETAEKTESESPKKQREKKKVEAITQ